MRSVVAQCVDQLILGHAGPAVDVKFRRPLAQVLHGPLLVTGGAATPGADLRPSLLRTRVGDPRGLLLRGALVAELLVHLLVLDARVGHLLHLRASGYPERTRTQPPSVRAARLPPPAPARP